eukprot:tig00000553_g2121.t1
MLGPLVAALGAAGAVVYGCRKRTGERKRVVVCGGGFAGVKLVHQLHGEFDVTLVDPKEFFEYTPGILRAFVDPGHFHAALAVDYAALPAAFVRGELEEVLAERVAVRTPEGRRELPFDFLVLATGLGYAPPVRPAPSSVTRESRGAELAASAAALRSASSVVVVGGGLVGVELAAEVAAVRPASECSVTLLEGGADILPGMAPRTRAYCRAWLEARGVRILCGVRVDKVAEAGAGAPGGARVISTSDGGSLRADCLLWATGVEGLSRVFALGDLMRHASGEAKLAHKAELNAATCAENIRRLARASPEPLLSYPPGGVKTPVIVCISLGPRDGALEFNGALLARGRAAALAKAFVERSKMAEIRGSRAAQLLWRVSDAQAALINRFVIPARAPAP